MTSAVPNPPDVTASVFEVEREMLTNKHVWLSNLQDQIGTMVRHANVLSRSVPLGGGYADEIAKFMAKHSLGAPESAVDSLVAFGREIDKLKQNTAEALERYTSKDESAGSEFDCIGG